MNEAIPTYCADKGWRGLPQIIRTETDWDKETFFTPRPNPNQWSRTMNSRVAIAENGDPIVGEIIVIANPNLQEQLLSDYDRKRKMEDKKWENMQENKKSLIAIIHGQLDLGTKNEMEISPGYEAAVENGNIVTIIQNLRRLCYGDDDGGMLFKPYKAVLAVKALGNFANSKPHDPHTFKDELKTKFQATLAITNQFPNGTIFMEHLLSENVDADGEPDPLTINDYFMMDEADKEMW